VSGFPEAKSGLFMNKHEKPAGLSPQEIASWLGWPTLRGCLRAIEAHLEGLSAMQEEVADRQDIANFADSPTAARVGCAPFPARVQLHRRSRLLPQDSIEPGPPARTTHRRSRLP